jgi:hypothetical protein
MAVVLCLAACAPVEKHQQNLDESLTNGRAYEIVKVDATVTFIELYGAIFGLSRRERAHRYEEIVDFSEIKDFIGISVKD